MTARWWDGVEEPCEPVTNALGVLRVLRLGRGCSPLAQCTPVKRVLVVTGQFPPHRRLAPQVAPAEEDVDDGLFGVEAMVSQVQNHCLKARLPALNDPPHQVIVVAEVRALEVDQEAI